MAEVSAFLPVVKLYARHWYPTTIEGGGVLASGFASGVAMVERPTLEECEELIEVCVQMLDDLIRGEPPDGFERGNKAGNNIAQAKNNDAANFSVLYGGDVSSTKKACNFSSMATVSTVWCAVVLSKA